MRSIALIGMRGCGKSAVGRELAGLLSWPHVDTDEVITQKAGTSIAEIFASQGEAEFRKRESAAIQAAFANQPVVISVGGGAVLDPANVAAIRAAATVVWLTASAEVLWGRIQNDPRTVQSRPPLTGQAGLGEIRELLAARIPLYESACDVVVDTEGLEPASVAETVLAQARYDDPAN